MNTLICESCGNPRTEREQKRNQSLCAACIAAYAGLADDSARPGNWIEQGLCAQTDPALFYPEKGEPTAPAKAICAECDVLRECREWALDTNQRHGVWGGLSPRERMQIRKARRAELEKAA